MEGGEEGRHVFTHDATVGFHPKLNKLTRWVFF